MSNKQIKALAKVIRQATAEAIEMVEAESTLTEQPEVIVRGTQGEIVQAIAAKLTEFYPDFDRLKFEAKCGL